MQISSNLPKWNSSTATGAEGSNELSELPPHLRDVYNETLGFEKIFIINLPSRTDYHDALSIAGATTGLKLSWIDGVRGEDVDERVLPPGGKEANLPSGKKGCWRSHMNALTKIVEEGVESALIIEGDADWDVRIKSEMLNFAKASNMLLQPLVPASSAAEQDEPQYADATFLDPENSPDSDEIPFDAPPSTIPPTKSPYGDNWDLLWLGHCGTQFPTSKSTPETPRGRVVQQNDPTVPEYRHFTYYFEKEPTIKQGVYGNHTRFYFHTRKNVCTIAYAISQKGARELLYELALNKMNDAQDIMHRQFCDGDKGRRHHTCLTTIPELFQSHRPAGLMSSFSDIAVKTSDKVAEKAWTANIRWSARMNMRKMLEGEGGFEDQYPDADAGKEKEGMGGEDLKL
ncbi:glycosyltransferase family 25 protein [Aulographum hederae CBS 113979]|uniref:Glycosyltransferase family 25 protein n=1 Tax=Aulographum hederae CBS 113979 TaxID=1176131 RepID=A0A6G1H6W1_9PEZI|nr:glycosyltransferase family 25 protein [Aulographum hederae CBS 113979]